MSSNTLKLVLDEGPAPVADLALIRQAFNGDRSASKALIDRLLPVVRARARSILRQSHRRRLGAHEGDDLVQEVWEALFKDGGKRLLAFDPAQGSLEGYVGTIAKNEILNRLQYERRKKRDVRLTDADDGALDRIAADRGGPEASAEASELARRIGDHLYEALPERGQLVLRYVFTDGQTAEETAAILAVNAQVVYNWVHKIRTEARSFLSRVGGA